MAQQKPPGNNIVIPDTLIVKVTRRKNGDVVWTSLAKEEDCPLAVRMMLEDYWRDATPITQTLHDETLNKK